MRVTHDLLVPLQADDSTGTKLAGSVINAAIFVVIVGLMTFVLVLLFKYGVSSFLAPLDIHAASGIA